MLLKKNGEDAYFAASNSKHGFYSYYESCFDDARVGRVFAIKGGPGTGKNRFMRDVAEAASRHSRQVESIYCSSDASSLDGVILTGGGECVALLDATAPHIYEPKSPGIREELVDLGAFWDRSRLLLKREEINLLNAQKSAAYTRAYRYLAGVGELRAVRDSLVLPFVRRDAIERCAKRLMGEIPVGRGYSMRHTLMRSVGMQGEVMLDGLLGLAERTVKIDDCRGIAHYLLEAIARIAEARRQPIRLSHDPIEPDVIDAVLLCDCGVLFVAGNGREEIPCRKLVCMRQFLDTARMGAVRSDANAAERGARMMLEGALKSLADVRESHFELEAIYSAAMDFDAKERYTKQFCVRLFGK
jgi:hypothetical protein